MPPLIAQLQPLGPQQCGARPGAQRLPAARQLPPSLRDRRQAPTGGTVPGLQVPRAFVPPPSPVEVPVPPEPAPLNGRPETQVVKPPPQLGQSQSVLQP
jgi:hypothetical protein